MAREKQGAGDRTIVLSLKGTAEFRQWVNGLADHERIPTTLLMEKALVEYADRRNYPEKPPRRTGSR